MPHPAIDLFRLEQLFRGDPHRVDQWIDLYLAEAPVLFERLRQAGHAGDAVALAALAHELKPQAHYLGSARMHDLLALIGERARSVGEQGCRETVDELLQLAGGIEAELLRRRRGHAGH